MDLLYYSDLDYKKVSKQFGKVVEQLSQADFNSAEVKKMPGTGFYRARLDYENRLLFRFASYKNKKYLLLLEVIYNHEYNKSRFLRGAKIDEEKFIEVPSLADVNESDHVELNYVNPSSQRFHLLDKVISFDDYQNEIFRLKPPVIIIGSAGSGKTVLTLEKLKTLRGRVLYVTLSSFLVENSANLYSSNQYKNDDQEVDFLSFRDFCSTLYILAGKEMNQHFFERWMQTRAHIYGIKDVHKLFEEFRGVLTGMDVDKPCLSRNEYLELGVRRSIFLGAERGTVYDAFEKYLEFIRENGFYDLNMVSFEYLKYCNPVYDFVVIDEAQDFTNIQLFLILNTLKEKGSFILCGDSNQIVHPNFFSWTNVKSMFYKQDMTDQDIKVLRANYRNSAGITSIANRLLKIKNARFGSIDKESTYMIEAVGEEPGEVVLLNDGEKARQMLNDQTSCSTRFAVLVMRQEDKAEAKKIFKTPLLFSVHESKGLEYENIIILNFINDYAREFNEIISDIDGNEVDNEDIVFSRFRDKTDKSLETYKFYINSLYVAITRGIKNIYLVESNQKHKLLNLLKLVEPKSEIKIKGNVSTSDEWRKEADKLEKQGKKEHADEIRRVYFSQQKPDWEPITGDNLEVLKKDALNPDYFNKKAKDTLFAYAMIYEDAEIMADLTELKYRRADNYLGEQDTVVRKYYLDYKNSDIKKISQLVGKYGVNYRDQFNLTPILAAIQANSHKAIRFLLEQGADITLTDNRGRNALRTAISQKVLKTSNERVTELVLGVFSSDSLRLKIDNKLVILPSRKFEYILVNIFLAVQKQYYIPENHISWQPCLGAIDIELIMDDFPEVMVPEFRKFRSYISSMLSKNEIYGSNPYNNKLFLRIYRGEYMLHPGIEVMVNEQWINAYQVMGMEKPEIMSMQEREERIRQEIRQHMREAKEKKKREEEQKLKDKEEELRKLRSYYRGYNDDETGLAGEDDVNIEMRSRRKPAKIKRDIPDEGSQLELPF